MYTLDYGNRHISQSKCLVRVPSLFTLIPIDLHSSAVASIANSPLYVDKITRNSQRHLLSLGTVLNVPVLGLNSLYCRSHEFERRVSVKPVHVIPLCLAYCINFHAATKI